MQYAYQRIATALEQRHQSAPAALHQPTLVTCHTGRRRAAGRRQPTAGAHTTTAGASHTPPAAPARPSNGHTPYTSVLPLVMTPPLSEQLIGAALRAGTI